MRGNGKNRKLQTGRRTSYIESLSNKYQMKLERRSWRWLRNGFLKKETEGLILVAQEQALRTNSVKYSIDKTSETLLCRFEDRRFDPGCSRTSFKNKLGQVQHR